MRFSPSKLFHAVVISGAALTGCAGTSQKPTTTTTAPGDTNAASATTKTTGPSQAASSPTTCPPGSERPYPPCYWIK